VGHEMISWKCARVNFARSRESEKKLLSASFPRDCLSLSQPLYVCFVMFKLLMTGISSVFSVTEVFGSTDDALIFLPLFHLMPLVSLSPPAPSPPLPLLVGRRKCL